MKTRRFLALAMIPVALATIGATCAPATPAKEAEHEAAQKAAERRPYVQQNDVEFKNYDRRQRMADDPTAILWCTAAFPIPASPMFTVPVVGKLTSGNKRPYPTTWVSGVARDYNPEVPGPDGMYGSNGEYRFGFTPGGMYVDLYNLATFCTTEPSIWQRQNTAVVSGSDPALLEAQKQAQSLLKLGKEAEANKVLEAALAKPVAGVGEKK